MNQRDNRRNRAASNTDSDRGFFLEKAAKSFQETVTRAGPVALASYTLIGAILVLGGIGYVLDLWRGSGHWYLLGGLFFGIIVGFYELAKAAFPK